MLRTSHTFPVGQEAGSRQQQTPRLDGGGDWKGWSRNQKVNTKDNKGETEPSLSHCSATPPPQMCWGWMGLNRLLCPAATFLGIPGWEQRETSSERQPGLLGRGDGPPGLFQPQKGQSFHPLPPHPTASYSHPGAEGFWPPHSEIPGCSPSPSSRLRFGLGRRTCHHAWAPAGLGRGGERWGGREALWASSTHTHRHSHTYTLCLQSSKNPFHLNIRQQQETQRQEGGQPWCKKLQSLWSASWLLLAAVGTWAAQWSRHLPALLHQGCIQGLSSSKEGLGPGP